MTTGVLIRGKNDNSDKREHRVREDTQGKDTHVAMMGAKIRVSYLEARENQECLVTIRS